MDSWSNRIILKFTTQGDIFMNKKEIKLKSNIILMDVETIGLEDLSVFDLSYLILNKKGEIIEKRSFLIREVFEDFDLMERAYYKDNIFKYLKKIRNKEVEVKSFIEVKKAFNDDIKNFKVKEIVAYNAQFDTRALTFTASKLSKGVYSRFIEKTRSNKNLKVSCIWHMACQTFLQDKDYKELANLYEWKTPKGNYKTGAEFAYRYISKNYEYEEIHMGIDDCMIEKEIFLEALQRNPLVDRSINEKCYTLVS